MANRKVTVSELPFACGACTGYRSSRRAVRSSSNRPVSARWPLEPPPVTRAPKYATRCVHYRQASILGRAVYEEHREHHRAACTCVVDLLLFQFGYTPHPTSLDCFSFLWPRLRSIFCARYCLALESRRSYSSHYCPSSTLGVAVLCRCIDGPESGTCLK